MKILFCYICLLIIFLVNSILPEEERKKLFDQYVTKVSLENFEESKLNLNSNSDDDISLHYDKTKIDELIKNYNFPSSFNFIQNTSAPVLIRDQQSCGCCWAMSSTTVLAYRFFKQGVTVNLSPQHELSCYIRNCDHGNKLIDPFLSLIINGTLTDECLPFTSGNGNIEQCPSTCKDPNVEYKKYYAKNAYVVNINQENIYNVTAIIMDQLVTNGPVMTSIEMYEDLYYMTNEEDCPNMVYTYDGESSKAGNHALTIVGYGYMKDKYYWLLQNTWGKDSCGDGFVKIEFGQVGIGSASFAEPLIKREDSGELIKLSYVKLDDFCNMEISTNNNLDNWKSQLIIVYEHVEKKNEFDYICGVTKTVGDERKKIYCNYEYYNIETNKGIYKYKTFRANGKKNNFVFDESFINKQFYFNGNDRIVNFASLFLRSATVYSFISENSRRFYFLYEPTGSDFNLPEIYSNEAHQFSPLSDCHAINITKDGKQYVAYCDVNDKELEYFEKCEPNGGSYMISQGLCNIKYIRNIITCRMDESKYPIFRIHGFDIVNKTDFSIVTTLHSSVEGNLGGFDGEVNMFIVVVNIEIGNENKTDIMSCYTGRPQTLEKNHSINCNIFAVNPQFDNIYVYPYSGIIILQNPFEVIITDIMKGNNLINSNPESNPEPKLESKPESKPEPKPDNSYSEFLNFNIVLFLLLFYVLI